MVSTTEPIPLVPVTVVLLVTTVPVEDVLNEVVVVLELRGDVYCDEVVYLLDSDGA